MIEVQQSDIFRTWLKGLTDSKAKARIAARIDRLKVGAFGDHRTVSGGVSELRIDVGPGYRVYYTLRGTKLVILLCGGDKGSQQRDIKTAQAMAKTV